MSDKEPYSAPTEKNTGPETQPIQKPLDTLPVNIQTLAGAPELSSELSQLNTLLSSSGGPLWLREELSSQEMQESARYTRSGARCYRTDKNTPS